MSNARRRAEWLRSLYSKVFLSLFLTLLLWSSIQLPWPRSRDGARNPHNVIHDDDDANMSMDANHPSIGIETIAGTPLPVTKNQWNDDETKVIQGRSADGSDKVDDVGIKDNGNDERLEKILTALKNLDEEMEGDIVLLSNKTKFIDAARIWQQHSLLMSPPLAIVEAKSAHDVQAALPILAGLSRDFNLPFRIKSGGHTYNCDFNTASEGVVLSLSKLQSTTVNAGVPGGRALSTNETGTTVTMQPGVRVEEFMRTVLDENGFSGIVASAADVGMGGFVLGGGYGLQSRMYGLAIDNVKSLDVVLTNGDIKSGLAEGDDLFWALRGAGGGNLGVVTSIEYQVYPSNDVKLAASVKIPVSEVTDFLQRLGDREAELAPEFTIKVHKYQGPDNRTSPESQIQGPSPPQASQSRTWFKSRANRVSHVREDQEDDEGFVTLSMYWMGNANPEEQLGMQYIKQNIVPLLSSFTADKVVYYYFSWSGMSRTREQDETWKSVWSAQSWNGFLLPANNTKAIWDDIQSSMLAMFLYCKFVSPKIELWGGAISKIPSNATAFPHRSAIYNIGVELLVPNGENVKAAEDEARLVSAIWPSIARHLSGVYINYPMQSLSQDEYSYLYWQDNLDRLVQLRQQYDPFHVLNFSQSIPIVM